MTRDEAAQIVRRLARTHRVNVDDELLTSWFNSALQRCEFGEGMSIAIALNARLKFMPKPAEFNEELKIRRRRENPTSQPDATGTKTPEIAKTYLAEMRKTLSQ